MKRVLFPLLVILCGTAAFADQIFLHDGSMLKGKIIQITEHDVEYDPEGPRAFDVVDKSSVVRIVHDDGKVIYITKNEAEPEEGSAEGKKQAGGFIDSWVRIAGFFSVSGPWGGILDKEQRLVRIYRPDLMRAYFIPKDYHLHTMAMGGGGEFDILPPAIKFKQKRAFDFTGIKFGIRGRYGFEFADSAIVDENVYYSSVEGYEQFRGRLMSYHYWAAGPVMDLVFGPRNNFFNFLIHSHAMAGQIFNGQLRAAAALRSAHQLPFELAGLYGIPAFITAAAPGVIGATRYLNKASFSGYTIRLGIGPHFTMNRYFPITFGFNITYAYSNITFRKAPLAYLDGRRKAALHEIGAEVSSGVHF